MFRTKFKNVQISADIVVEEIIALLILTVVIKIFVALSYLQATVGFLAFTLNSTGFTCSIVHVGAGWMKTGDNCVHT